jgi:hypothetical protein
MAAALVKATTIAITITNIKTLAKLFNKAWL